MTDVFVRVSIFYKERQLDVSLPYNRPAVDVVDDAVDLFDSHSDQTGTESPDSIATADTHTWVLSSPKTGVIDPHSTLAEHGVQDGSKLYLTRRQEAARTPFVDDAIAEVRSTIGAAQWVWSGAMRSSGALAVLTFLIILAGTIAGRGLWLHDPPLPPQGWAQLTIIVVSALIGLGLALWRKHEWMRFLGALLPLATFIIAEISLRGTPAPHAAATTVIAVALSAIPAMWAAGRKAPAGGLGGIVTALIITLVAGVVLAGTHFGGNIYAIAAWSAWLPILVLLIAPSVGLRSTGLPALIRHNEAGDQVEREAIRTQARRAEAISRGVSWAAVVLALLILIILTASPVWQHGLIAVVLCFALLLRQNGFADARIITTLITTGVLGLSLTAGAAVRWAQNQGVSFENPAPWWLSAQTNMWVWLVAAAVLLLGAGIAVAIALRQRDDVEEARVARILSMLDILVCLASIPVILAAQGLYQYFWATI
ncbi:type VII secretion integral membrane protein EccD [Corynebacterium sp. MSK041]|uniref:type VII secretion integral membrane protein EccD n=1 Tax=Corynebacterium sp. MSK041 TaxID=3050194 RepID=UPI00254ADD1A|nr:type VII secretion integral membrane protein EccD [Corynebacterium sp. MSK041]MDK8795945.1 type VII secretion integral membrane protein EccD [Corynebacterium sp. MSK041]